MSAAFVAAVLVALGVASGAGAAQVGAASPDDQAAIAAALVRDFGISEQQAAANVQTQAAPGTS